MKSQRLVLLTVLCFASPLLSHAQRPASAPTVPGGGTPPPEITPRPSVSPTPAKSPSPTPSPSPSPAASPRAAEAQPASSPSPADFRGNVDALPAADVQEALQLLKSNYIRPDVLAEPELSRATLQGALERIGPGVLLLPAIPQPEPSPFYSEILEERAGYLRLGELSKNAIGELDGVLKSLKEKNVKAAILDLRATPASSDFDLGAEVLKRFCAKGRPLFSLKKPNTGTAGKSDRLWTSNTDPSFQGLLVVLVDNSNAGAAEVIAAVLRSQTKALIVGEKTTGRAFEFADMTLHGSGALLRVAVAEVTLPDGGAIAGEGVKPDIAVAMLEATKREAMQLSREKGVAAVITETERVHMNEAALVAGRNPELEALQASQRNKGERPKPPTLDVQLQRAVDLITTVAVFETKRAQK